MSIQLLLDGHSFSADSLPAEGNMPATICLLTAKSMLVPREQFDESLAANYFAVNGMPLSPQETVVWSDIQQPIIALTAIDKDILETIREKTGEHIHFTTPLLYTPKFAGAAVWLYRAGKLLYIKVYETLLRFAEVVPAADDTEILCLMERLNREFPLEKYEMICVDGDNPRKLRKLLGKYYKRVVCE